MTEKPTPSRFNLQTIATFLRRKATDIHAFTNKDQQSGHYVRIQGNEPTPFQTTIGWVEDGKDTMNVHISVEGMRRVQRIGGSTVFTTDKEDDGARLAVTAEGVVTFFPENIDTLVVHSGEIKGTETEKEH